MSFVLDQETLQLLSLVERRTGANIKDCMISEDSAVFVVQPGEIAKAIGKGGQKVQEISRMLKKKVRFVEFSEDLEQFVKNLCHPVKVREVQNDEGTITIVPEDYRGRGVIIGRNAQNLRQIESLVQRYFDVQELKVAKVE